MEQSETSTIDASTKLPSSAAPNATESKTNRHNLLGIKTKLLLAFCALAALTAIASAIAVYGFFLIDRTVTRITADTVPTMAISLQLAEKSAEISAIAPALMASANQQERVLEQISLEESMMTLTALTQSLNASGIAQETIKKLKNIQEQINAKLSELNKLVEKRLRLKVQREEKIGELARAHGRFDEVLEPVIDDTQFNLIISGEDVTARSTKAITDLIESGVYTIQPLLTINAELNLTVGLLSEVVNIPDPILLQPIRERFIASAATIERNLRQLSNLPEVERLQQSVEVLLALGKGHDNIFVIRERELNATGSIRQSMQGIPARLAQSAKNAHEAVLTILAPFIDSATFDLVINAEELSTQGTQAINQFIDGGVNTLHTLLTLRSEGNLAAGLLVEAAGVLDPANLQPIRERFTAAVGHIQKMLAQIPESASDVALRKVSQVLIDFGRTDDNIFDLRQGELLQSAAAQKSLERSRSLGAQLVEQVAVLVKDAQRASDAAALHSSKTINDGKWIMMLITAVSMLGAALTMLYYVGPRIIRPLENITRSMADLAAGDTSVDIPGRNRSDEIGRMAQALGVFRDTAIEVQKSNLVEISETRRRLMDAIESISEGFSLYDSEDRLVVCNSKYQSLLYSGVTDEITPGMTFESIVRHAVNSGYVKDAQNRVEEWVDERLARHRDPGEPHVQQRSDGRWIIVSERKTDDGSTVAVYSDITDLKQREEQLNEKSHAMEQLSNQLAKYLSPQVYQSIFSGKQEVKLTSRRKKLTVFFSDIVSFTETADRLESEDLTQLLNHYLTEMSQIALDYGATIDKYIGDAIVIFFGDPESRGAKEDALACVQMAIAMRRRMRELEAVWRASGIEKPLRCRTGISTGHCTVGNFGSEDRMDYTIIGGGVNLAARLEAAATPGEILVSYETYAHVKDKIRCEEHGEIKVKGIAYPVATYQVIDSYDNLVEDDNLIHEDHPNLRLDLNLEKMSTDDRKRAETVLRRSLERLSEFDNGNKPVRGLKKISQ